MYIVIVYECLCSSRDFFMFGFLKDIKIDEENLFYSYLVFYFFMFIGFMYMLVILINWYGLIINCFF